MTDLFHTTNTVKTQHVTKSRGRHCGDIELVSYLTNTEGPVTLVLDLHIVHDRLGSSSAPSLDGHWHYPDDIDKSLNDDSTDKIRKYRADYNNNPPITVSFVSDISSTSGRLHSEFIRLSLLQTHRETNRFFFRFRSSTCVTQPWTIPLPPCGVLGHPENKSHQHPQQGYNFTY
jgi:hypothetical protein